MEEVKPHFDLTSLSFLKRLLKYIKDVGQVLNLDPASLILFLNDLNNKEIDQLTVF